MESRKMSNLQGNQLVTEWTYQGTTDFNIPDNALGFLYRITHTSGKWYIGRKLLTKAATKMVNGKKKKIRKDSDWKDYWSSSPGLKQWIADEGTDNFKREILIFVTTKAAMSYGEEFLLYATGSLFDLNCVNENIRAKIYRKWFGKTPNLHNELVAILPQSHLSSTQCQPQNHT